MKIHEDGAAATAMPSRKAVSFREMDKRHSGRTPLRETGNRTPHKSPYFNAKSGTPFKSPSTTKASMTSNSFRQGLKKGFTPTSTKPKTNTSTNHEKENDVEGRHQDWRYQSNQKSMSKTPSSASALRRTLRSTVQPQDKQQQSLKSLQQKNVSLKTSSNITSKSEPFQSVATAMSLSSSHSTSNLLGRSRLLGKGGVAPGKLMQSSLGPPTRVAPKTPNTLLRTELEDEDEFDESFLLSPPPGALWNALNLSSGGVKGQIISPTVTTGLIVVSPKAAEQIHTWSSTKKGLSSIDSSPEAMADRASPTVPRALMQTPHEVSTAKPTHSIQTSPPRTQVVEHEVCTKKTEHVNTKEASSSVKDESPIPVETNTNSYAKDKLRHGSVKKSTKGGVEVDMTGFFSLKDDQSQKMSKKQWVKSEPLSSSMPAALRSRLNSNRPKSSKKIQNQEAKTSSTVSKLSSPKTKSLSSDIKSPIQRSATSFKPPVKRSTTIIATNNVTTTATLSKILKKKTTFVEETTAKASQLNDSKNKIRGQSKATIDSKRKAGTKQPQRRQNTKQSALLPKNDMISKSNRNAAQREPVKSLKKQAPRRRHISKGVENKSLKSTIESLVNPEFSRTKGAAHSGGLAFDVGFDDAENTTIPQKTSTKPRKNSKLLVSRNESVEETSNAQNWADKQCEAFVGWLNYTLNPEELDVNGQECVASGLRALIIHRRLAEGRLNALQLFKGETMFQIRTIIAKEITRGKLSIRSDRDVTADVHLRRNLTSLLLSYTTPWLRLALEVMSGECINPVPISEDGPKTFLARMKLALEHFIKRRFLSDDNTLRKYTKGRSKVLSGTFGARYKEEMRNLVLSRVMILVFFLDRAKASNVLENVPRLFNIASNVKSTRDVLVEICRECLSAEGDIVKHLSRIGLNISYVQDPIDEVNFTVKNLATDLRDGVILTRLSEIVTAKPFKKSMSSLRLPAVSRLQKKFNVNLAFSEIKNFGIAIAEGINAHHIMDGHREMVLALMWCIIAQSCLLKLLRGDQVEEEIRNVIQSSEARKKLDKRYYARVENTLVRSELKKGASTDEILKDLLIRWSHAVCSSFGFAVTNLRESFANGKALCLLVHYYHPSMIPIDEILREFDANSAEDVTKAERRNWKKASKSMQELGGIPDMLPICDSKNPPNEKSMILCLSYLCSRLMESSKEIFATILIQACYRKYMRRVLMEKKIVAASTIFRIWTLYRENYFRQQEQRFKDSVAVLENFVLSHKHSLKQLRKERLKKEHILRSVTTIQRVVRGWRGRAQFERLRVQNMAAKMIQSTFRRCCAKRVAKELRSRRDSAIVIQSAFRRYIAHEKFLDYRYVIIEMQRCARGYIARKELKSRDYAALVIQQAWWSYMELVEMDTAATVLQKTWRGVLGRRKWIEKATHRDAASAIQKAWRGYQQRMLYSISIQSAIIVQKTVRGFLGRKAISVNRSRHAATSIQKIWRGFSVQVQYQVDILDIVCVQSLVRRFLSRKEYISRTNALSTIQCAYRSFVARRKMRAKIREEMEERLRYRSAVLIQSHVRTLIAQQNIFNLQCAAYVIQNHWRHILRRRLMTSAATKIQSMYRSRTCRRLFLRSRMAAINVQRSWRGFAARQSVQVLSYAATMIQCTWRRYWIYSDYTLYLKEKKSVTLIQAHIRRMLATRTLDLQMSSARLIQSHWRKHKQSQLETTSATKIQSIFRSHWSRFRFIQLKEASVVLQQMARARQARQVLYFKQKQRQYQESAVLIQKLWRGFSAQVQFQIDILDIICVQSVARRYIASKAYRTCVSAASVIQRAYKCAAARRERAFRKLVLDTMVMESSTKIQTVVRGHLTRSKFLAIKAASINIQRTWRGITTRNFLGHLSQNASIIQSAWRMHKYRKNYVSFVASATKIQACFRQHSAQTKHSRMKKSAVCIQRCFRGYTSRQQLSNQHRACTMIQSHWRRCFAQNNYLLDLLEIKSATLIQASFRMYMHRMDYMVIKYSAHTIQRFTRGLLTRVDLAVKHFAASEIQRVWRGRCVCSSKSMIKSVLKIQSLLRMGVAMKRAGTLRIEEWSEIRNRNKNATVIQTSFRKYKLRQRRENAAKIIQKTYRSHSECKRIQAASRGVIELQARFRGAQVRKNRSKKLCQLAHQIKKETRRALRDPTLRLGYRTSRALEILQTSQSLTKIMDAVKELEASTRLSVVCCQVFTKVNAANILLYLIQSCNRSVPHMELKEHILLTLENVAQYPSLVGSFAHYKYAEVFLDNVQVFRDKDGIFCLAVLLLGRITKANADVAQFCATHEHLKRLKEVYRVVSRRRIRSRKNKVLSEKTRRLRKCGLAKRDDFDRETSTRLLKEMIEAFSKIDVPHITITPHGPSKFDWNELQYSPLI